MNLLNTRDRKALKSPMEDCDWRDMRATSSIMANRAFNAIRKYWLSGIYWKLGILDIMAIWALRALCAIITSIHNFYILNYNEFKLALTSKLPSISENYV